MPNSLMEPIHNRMPVILPREAKQVWLDPDAHLVALRELLLPYNPGLMQAYEVSTLVNSPRNQGPEVVAPVDGHSPGSGLF